MQSVPAMIGAVVMTVAAALPAWAQEPASIGRCRSVVDNTERLNCYDKLAASLRSGTPPPGGHGYQAVSLTDLKLDYDSLRGQGVEVSGTLMLSGEMALLASGAMDASPLLLDLKAVPRDQRRALLERCTVPGCAVTMRGKVDRVMEQRAIVADGAAIQQGVDVPEQSERQVGGGRAIRPSPVATAIGRSRQAREGSCRC